MTLSIGQTNPQRAMTCVFLPLALTVASQKIDSRFDRVDAQFAEMRIDMKEVLFEFKESMRKEMFRFAGFLTITGLTALGIFAAFAR